MLAIQVAAFVLWTLIARPYTSAYCRTLDLTRPRVAGRVEIVHRPQPDSALSPDNMSIGIIDRRSGARFFVPYGAGTGSYFPNAFLLGLVIVTPMSGQRRLRDALWAFSLLQIALAARVLLIYLKLMSGGEPFLVMKLPHVLDRALHISVSSFSYSSAGGVFAALLIWVVLVASGVRGRESRPST
jgi:hypothetical protein